MLRNISRDNTDIEYKLIELPSMVRETVNMFSPGFKVNFPIF